LDIEAFRLTHSASQRAEEAHERMTWRMAQAWPRHFAGARDELQRSVKCYRMLLRTLPVAPADRESNPLQLCQHFRRN